MSTLISQQQLSICVRWVDESLNPHEDFLGFFELPSIKSDTIVSAMKDVFIRCNLPISNLHGQMYDGASNMLGKKVVLQHKSNLYSQKL